MPPSNASTSASSKTGTAMGLRRRRLSVGGGGYNPQSTNLMVDNVSVVTSTGAGKPLRRRLSTGMGVGDFKLDGATADKTVTMKNGRRQSVANSTIEAVSASKGSSLIAKFATKTKTGVVPHNPHKVNQDSSWCIPEYANDPSQSYWAVCDGHGVYGHDVSGFVKKRLPATLQKHSSFQNNPQKALEQSTIRIHKELNDSSIDVQYSGTTAVHCFIRGSTIYTANTGDSRAMIARQQGGTWTSIALSEDQKPDLPDEKKRILMNNGRVECFKDHNDEDIGPARVWLKHQDAPGLAMARSLGDMVAQSCGVIPDPQVSTHTITSDDKFLVIASDGVWEFLENNDVMNIVRNHYLKSNDPQAAANALVQQSVLEWNKEEEVVDDITCVIVFFNN